jgi:hypothetical protein
MPTPHFLEFTFRQDASTFAGGLAGRFDQP